MTQGIKLINITFDDGESISINDSYFSNLYISNIDEHANEIPYEKLLNTSVLYANFFTLKINRGINQCFNDNIIDKIIKKKNIAEIVLNTINGKQILFNLSSNVDPFNSDDINQYDQSFIDEDSLCLLITPFNIKYKNHLFI